MRNGLNKPLKYCHTNKQLFFKRFQWIVHHYCDLCLRVKGLIGIIFLTTLWYVQYHQKNPWLEFLLRIRCHSQYSLKVMLAFLTPQLTFSHHHHHLGVIIHESVEKSLGQIINDGSNEDDGWCQLSETEGREMPHRRGMRCRAGKNGKNWAGYNHIAIIQHDQSFNSYL